ncbi:MAG: AEC family transporter [Methylococcaceae bacterium]|nr:AEC family transporter [Methylococcaceae bacterium]
MTSTLLQMSVIIACGAIWRFFTPLGISAQQTRQVLTTVVYYLLLPALVLEVLWHADIGIHSLYYTGLGIACIVVAGLCSWLLGRLFKFQAKQMGAVLLAAAFANVTFLGLPVLEQLFGSWARSVAIQLDLFAVAPFLYTFGILVARHFGRDGSVKPKSVLLFLNTPPFWAAFLAVILNLNNISTPLWLTGILQKLAAAVVPLMLLSLGLALSWQTLKIRQLPYILVVSGIKLLLMPLVALTLVTHLDLPTPFKAAAIMDLAMPSMLMGVVLCDRYHLDSSLYAMLVTVTTALSLITLPFWYALL